MSTADTAEHMTDISTQENNINNEIPADSASLHIQAIANTLVPKIMQGVNERLPDLVTNILSQKSFVSTAGYADESDEEESDRDIDAQNNQIMRDAGAQITSNRDAGAQQASNRDTGPRQTTENMDADAQNCGKKKDIITPQIIRGRANDTDSQNNKSFDNVDELLQYASNSRRKRKHSAAASTPQRDRTLPLQMSQILHQLGDEMGMNVDESRNINEGLSKQLMHSCLHASSETSSLNKIMKLYALPSNLSKMTVPKMNEEVCGGPHIKTMKDLSPLKKNLYILFKTMWQKH